MSYGNGYGYGYGYPMSLDRNGDGFLSRQEFATAGSAYGIRGARAAVKIFDALDTNRNGYLDAWDRYGPSYQPFYPNYPYYPPYY